ncbi:glycosyltransferase [Methylomarinum vadi]|uniref:glycosyltransferase n=1 Tax=Methylomarinum vadi TaxID=438855 RepID=UPI0004DF8DF2|nr:glycosyltransferase [Methylomarinum vadi]
MKIGIQTWGSNGDIRPMIALADGLQKAGHSVTLVVTSLDNRRYAKECGDFSIAYRQVPEHMEFDLEDFAQQTFRMNTAQWLVALLDAAFFPHEQTIYQAARQLAEENDLVIGHHFLYPLKIAALKSNKPFYSVTFCHGVIPSASVPPFRFPDLGRWLNPLQWRLMDYAFDFILKKQLTRLWNQEGLPEIKHVMTDLLSSDQLNLIAVDPVFCPSRSEWQPRHQACGFLNLPTDQDDWSINDALQQFLNDGPAPVYMTFGSLQQAVPEWSMELFTEAARLAGCRAIIQASSNNYPENSRQGNLFFIGRHPHQKLFKHCAAVVHHGGAGTTHSATLCGRPSIVIPFMDEQLFWGRAVEKLDMATKPLPARKADAAQLASRIKTILSDDRYRTHAEQVGEIISRRQGVRNAVDLILRRASPKDD